jgi:predicted nucleic acid-binding Zn ribbon protein
MPTYTYVCRRCKQEIDMFHSMKEDRSDSECQSLEPSRFSDHIGVTSPRPCLGKMRKKIGAGGRPIFKGSGFYETDYKGKS